MNPEVIEFGFFPFHQPEGKLSRKTLYKRASYKKVFRGLFLVTKVALLLLNKRIPEKSDISGQKMTEMNDLQLKDSKSNVCSNFEGGNAASKSYHFFVNVRLFHRISFAQASGLQPLSREILLLLFTELAIGPFLRLIHS